MFYCGVVRGDLDNCLLKTMAGFFSFGTSDLTQTTMGLACDDYMKFSKDYGAEVVFPLLSQSSFHILEALFEACFELLVPAGSGQCWNAHLWTDLPIE